MATNVNKPANKKVKDADVNRKLQLYGIYSAFQNGKVPSNDQIDVALNSFLGSKALSNPSTNLSEEGKLLVADAREVVKAAKNLLLSKNDGNLIQDFIWQTMQFDSKAVNTPNAPVNKDTAKRDGDEALRGLRTLGTLLITNGQFRKLLQDASTLVRDMAGDAATNAAGKVRPSNEALDNMDRPADDNVWHEKPDFSKENLKKQAKDVYGGNPKDDARDVAHAGADGAGVDKTVPENTDPQAVDRMAGQNAARTVAMNKIDAHVDEDTKEAVKARNEAYRLKARNYLNKKMPQERKEQTVFRLKKIILECQQHEDYSEAMQTLLRLAENYGKHGRAMTEGSAGTAKETRTGLAAAEADLRTLIERFANGTSTSNLWDAIHQIYVDAQHDSELKQWFKDMDTYVRRCLLEQGYILEPASGQAWDQLYDHGRYLLRDKYRTHTDAVIDELKFIGDQFDQDAQNNAFAQAVQKLFLDLGNDSDGNTAFKPHLIKDLTETIIPAIMENTAYIPVPRIEFSDHEFDAIIENLVLESDNFMPNVLEVANENYFRWGRKKIANKNKNSIEVKVAGIQMDLRDVSFHIKRKQGFPSITDTGVADLTLPGEGFSFKMKISTADAKDKENFFKIDKVDVDMKGLKIKLTQSKHKLLFSLFRPLALKAINPALQKAIEKAIKEQCQKADALMYQIKLEADRVKAEAKSNPENVPNMYERYYNAAQKRILEGKQKAQEIADDKKVNVAFTKQDSIFPSIHLPGGISSKATEYKELAQKGERWESPVFSIGSASKSHDIPMAPKVQTKTRPNNSHTNGATTLGATNGAPALGATNGGALGKSPIGMVPEPNGTTTAGYPANAY